jgi:hypothetical protein
MKRILKQLTIALVISVVGFFGTVAWFHFCKPETKSADRKPMARVENAGNEVQRKPSQRVIWESVYKNEEIFPGEAVRTAPNADAQVLVLKTGTTVHIEPDTLVVLDDGEKGPSLDFQQGNIFVQSSKTPDGGVGLTLKIGDSEVKFKSADLSLSKSPNGNVAVEVTRGEAELNQGTKKTVLTKDKSAELTEQGGVSVATDRVQILQPAAGETLFLNLANGERLDVNWQPLPPGYSLWAEVGGTRISLSRVPGSQTTGESGQLHLGAKPGRRYLRLVATTKDSKMPPLSSIVVPFEVAPKSVPTLVYPAKDASILKKEAKAPVAFQWESATTYQAQVFEVATDPQFKHVKLHENMDGEAGVHRDQLPDGDYFWRVTGFLRVKDKAEALMSEIHRFSVASNWEIKPPELTGPANSQHLSYTDAQKPGLLLKWQGQQGVQRYRLTVEQKSGEAEWKKLQEQEIETAFYRIVNLKAGVYRWQVASLDERGGEPKASPPSEFAIDDLPKIEWSEKVEGDAEYVYKTPVPTLAAHWNAMATAPAYYRYKIGREGDLDDAEWQTTKQTSFETPVADDGKYQVVIEAMNTKSQILGQSEVRNFIVKGHRLLPAPQWAANTPEVLKADGKGRVSFEWEKVNGAQNYLMILETKDGRVVDQQELTRTTASLRHLKPGAYNVQVKSIDDLRRQGIEGEKRKIEVP